MLLLQSADWLLLGYGFPQLGDSDRFQLDPSRLEFVDELVVELIFVSQSRVLQLTYVFLTDCHASEIKDDWRTSQ